MSNIYGKASNRLNELKDSVPLTKKEFDHLINSVASWKNYYSPRRDYKLARDLSELREKWEKKAIKKSQQND